MESFVTLVTFWLLSISCLYLGSLYPRIFYSQNKTKSCNQVTKRLFGYHLLWLPSIWKYFTKYFSNLTNSGSQVTKSSITSKLYVSHICNKIFILKIRLYCAARLLKGFLNFISYDCLQFESISKKTFKTRPTQGVKLLNLVSPQSHLFHIFATTYLFSK